MVNEPSVFEPLKFYCRPRLHFSFMDTLFANCLFFSVIFLRDEEYEILNHLPYLCLIKMQLYLGQCPFDMSLVW